MLGFALTEIAFANQVPILIPTNNSAVGYVDYVFAHCGSSLDFAMSQITGPELPVLMNRLSRLRTDDNAVGLLGFCLRMI